MGFDEFESRLWRSSVQLVRLKGEGVPNGVASGCLVDYCGRRLVLSVSHATGDQLNWAIQLRYVPGQRCTEAHQIGSMNFLSKGVLGQSGLTDVDFAYAEVPADLVALRQDVDSATGRVLSQTPIDAHALTPSSEPNPDREFGFCGMVKPDLQQRGDQMELGGELRVYRKLTFSRTDGDYHYFKLPFPHPGHDHFQGCSGAPILDEAGTVVALVCGGCAAHDELWGISLRAYQTPLDIFVGNVP